MIARKLNPAWLLKSIACTALVVSLAACSSNDNATTDIDEQTSDSDDPAQETVNDDGTSTFVVPLSGAQEAPPIDAGAATGEGNVTIDKATGAISGSVAVSGLSGEASMAHIHQALAGNNGGVVVTLAGNADKTLWSVPADTVLSAEALIALNAGGLYFNVHTAANQGGELRGQIVPEGILVEYTELSGPQEVPPVTTDVTGIGVSTLNPGTGSISSTVFVTGLDDATMAHIHSGAEGETGPPIVTLAQDTENPGVWRTETPTELTADQVQAFEDDALYFNVHSAVNPDGEIRGQL